MNSLPKRFERMPGLEKGFIRIVLIFLVTMIGIIIFMDLPNSRKPNDKVQPSPNGQRCTRTLAQNTLRRLIGKWWATPLPILQKI